MRGFVFLVFGVAACAASEPPSPRVVRGTLRALTYNVHGLPPAITGDATAERMAAISPHLDGFDVVAIQENFFFSDELMAAVEQPYVEHFHDTLPGRLTHSGLTLVSALAIEEPAGESWAACHGKLEGASDCLGSKGYQFGRVRLSETSAATVDVFNLHMEAGGGDEDALAREAQASQLLSAIVDRSAGRAVIVVGDTNMRPSDEAEAALLARIRGSAALVDACDVTGCPEPDHIDRFLYRSGDHLALRASAWHKEGTFVDAGGQPLSDHPALSAAFAWETL